MDARSLRLGLTLAVWSFATALASAAQYKTDNFVAYAPTEEFAREVAMTAEQWRARLAMEWLGRKLPNWYKPCPIKVKVGQLGAGGATTFNFDRGQVFGWEMQVQGTRERILDSVIPHEVSHTIFASHFRRPLPRWADEGAATLAEHESEQRRQDLTLKQVWNTRKIPLNRLLAMTEYPTDMQDVMTLYAQGYSLAGFLVQHGGKARYLRFLDDAEKQGWEKAIKAHYRFDGVGGLETTWGQWVLAGSPEIKASDTLLAGNDAEPADDATIRAQSPDAEPVEPPAPVRTASAEPTDLGGFLPPRPETRTAAAGPDETPATASGKEARPAPLGGFQEDAGFRRSRGSVTETGDAESIDGRRPLPRTSRVEPTASRPAGHDFFSGKNEPTLGASRQELGMSAFPMASVQ